jgi:GMP synthase (glutamine-hydrolysing)
VSVRLGILKPGSTYAEMILRFGDYDAWFRRALGEDIEIAVHGLGTGELPQPDRADGWIVTGARDSVTRPGPTTGPLLDWIRDVARRETPLLGVCYGHQAICEALGGRVERHPGGWELGTTEVELTAAGRGDPLFAGFPPRFRVQTTHEDYAALLPPDATLLAVNPHTEAQAIAIGSTVRGVQFHPEVTEEIARDFVDRRRHLVVREPKVGASPHAADVLANFVESFVRKRRAGVAGAG